jgi:hypothetical protein
MLWVLPAFSVFLVCGSPALYNCVKAGETVLRKQQQQPLRHYRCTWFLTSVTRPVDNFLLHQSACGPAAPAVQAFTCFP